MNQNVPNALSPLLTNEHLHYVFVPVQRELCNTRGHIEVRIRIKIGKS